jgi:Kef-type K+ transport system membrane component KefB
VLLAAGSALAGPAIGVVLAVALSSTAVGMLLPILKDAGDLTSPFGTAVVANGAVGEFLPLIAMSLLLSGRPLGSAAAVLAMFTLAATVVLWLAVWMRHDRLHAFIRQTQHTSSQFGLRVVFLVLGGLVAMDLLLGLDILLGAFVTGLVLRALLADAPRDDIELVESKLQGLGFGFIVPVFFIHAGLTFDLRAMMAQPALFGVALAAAATLFVVRGLLGMLSAPAGSSPHARLALGAYTATALPIIVAATAAATAAGVIDGGLTAALVGGGLVSVLVGPVVGAALRRRDLAAAHPDRSDVGAFVSDLG